MIQNRWKLLTISTLSLVMVGCDDGENLEEMQASTAELDRLTTESVDDLNQLVVSEGNLQAQFDETMESDSDLATLSDGSSPVFENIESRRTLITQLEEKEAEMITNQETLATYEGERLNQQEVDQVISNVDSFSEHLSTYLEAYASTLDSQENYFNGLAGDDATYEDFIDGITTINEERESLREPLTELDAHISELDNSINQLHSSIEEQLTEED